MSIVLSEKTKKLLGSRLFLFAFSSFRYYFFAWSMIIFFYHDYFCIRGLWIAY